jgi:hypothetical protein
MPLLYRTCRVAHCLCDIACATLLVQHRCNSAHSGPAPAQRDAHALLACLASLPAPRPGGESELGLSSTLGSSNTQASCGSGGGRARWSGTLHGASPPHCLPGALGPHACWDAPRPHDPARAAPPRRPPRTCSRAAGMRCSVCSAAARNAGCRSRQRSILTTRALRPALDFPPPPPALPPPTRTRT